MTSRRAIKAAQKLAGIHRVSPAVVRGAIRRLVDGGDDALEAGVALILVLEAVRNPPDIPPEDLAIEAAQTAVDSAPSTVNLRSVARGVLSGT